MVVDDTGTDQDNQNAQDDGDQGDNGDSPDNPETSDSAGEGEGPDDNTPSGPVDDDDNRLDELGDRIQSVRSEAEEAVDGVAEEPDKEFHESGDEKATEADDQTAAPG